MTRHRTANGARAERGMIASALRPSRAGLASAVLCASLSGLLSLAALWALIDVIVQPSVRQVVVVGALWVATAVSASLSSWLAHNAEAQFSARLSESVVAHLMRLPESTVARYSGNDLRRLVTDNITALHHMVAHLPAEIAALVVVPAASIVTLVTVAGPLSLLALIPGLIASGYYLWVVPRTSAKHGAESMRVMGDIVTAVDDYTRGIATCRLYSAEAGARADYERESRAFTSGMVTWIKRVATLGSVAVAAMQAAVTYAVAYLVGYGNSVEVLSVLLMFSLAVVTPALRLGHGLDYVRAGRIAAGELKAFAAEAETRGPTMMQSGIDVGSPGARPVDAVISLDRVSLQAEQRVLWRDLSHDFRPATMTAIRGVSGTGKTTLLRCMAGHEDPTSGNVVLHGDPGETAGERPLHERVMLIMQGSDVLAGTVRENLAVAAPAASDASMLEALDRAQLTVALDADAAVLSGGEKQRLGLARVFVGDARVVLCDEPTSALDQDTAQRVMRELLIECERAEIALIVVTHDDEVAGLAHETLVLGESTGERSGDNHQEEQCARTERVAAPEGAQDAR
ncbi:MAG: ATP-binding cassette domain-containing protein [Microbacteriaceae bacterium]